MSPTLYTEIGKTKCPACYRMVASVKPHTKGEPPGQPLVSRHLYQEQVILNEVGAPTEYAPGFCPGSFNVVKD